MLTGTHFLSTQEVASINRSKLDYATKIHTFGFNELEIEITEAYVNQSSAKLLPPLKVRYNSLTSLFKEARSCPH